MKKHTIGLFGFLAILVGIFAPAYGAGTIPSYSLSQQNDRNGPLDGCRLDIYQAGTVGTRQNAYSDTALTLVLPNPLICDANGRLPQFFLADGLIKIRLSDKNGTTQVTADNIQVIGASSGGGGGGSIDPTTILATGDIKARYGTGVLSGFVRLNGRTIGSATSGATERANSDCQALFEYLWGADSALAVSGGRGASANADWVANKQIALPDGRGRTIAGLDDMGGSSASRLNTALSSTTLGAVGGEQQHTIVGAEMPAHTHAVVGNTDVENVAHQHTVGFTTGAAQSGAGASPLVSLSGSSGTGTSSSESQPHVHAIAITSASTGGSGAHNVVQPTIIMTFYQKL